MNVLVASEWTNDNLAPLNRIAGELNAIDSFLNDEIKYKFFNIEEEQESEDGPSDGNG